MSLGRALVGLPHDLLAARIEMVGDSQQLGDGQLDLPGMKFKFAI